MADLLALLLMMAAFAVLLLAGSALGAAVSGRGAADGRLRAGPPHRAAADPGDGRLPAGPAAPWRRVLAVLAGRRGAGRAVSRLVRQRVRLAQPDNSNGLFRWTRTMLFANCAVIKPPAGLQALCPNRQPGRLNQPVAPCGRCPKRYLWDHQAWQWQPPSTGLVPDTAAFTKAKNDRAMKLRDPCDRRSAAGLPACRGQRRAAPLRRRQHARFPGLAYFCVRAQQGQPRLRPGRGARL